MEDYVEHKVKGKVEKYVKKGFKIVFMIIAAIIFILLFGYIFMLLWNWLMPEIFGLGTLVYWQAVGLLLLAKLLFGGFEGPGSRNGNNKSRKRCVPQDKWMKKNDFSKWKHYEKFWEEEGESAYKAYVERLNQEKQ